MQHFMGRSKHTLTPPTYYQGVKTPTPSIYATGPTHWAWEHTCTVRLDWYFHATTKRNTSFVFDFETHDIDSTSPSYPPVCISAQLHISSYIFSPSIPEPLF